MRADAEPYGAATTEASRPTTAIVFYWSSFMAMASGSHVRVAAQLAHLRQHFDHVVLYSHANHRFEPWTSDHRAAFRERFPDVELVLDDRPRFAGLVERSERLALAVGPLLAAGVVPAPRALAGPAWRRLVAEHPTAAILVNFLEGVTMLPGLPLGRTVIDTHDVKFVKRAKMRGASTTSLPSLLRLRSEATALNVCAGVIAITANDAAFFKTVLANRNVFFVPEFNLSIVPSPPPGPEAFDLLFVGSDTSFNVEGLGAFLEENAAWLARYRINVCGRVCRAPRIVALAAERPNVFLSGFVEDIAAAYANARACISPVEGTGLKIKVLEALRHGRPVLGSPHSLGGLSPGYDGAVWLLNEANTARLLGSEEQLAAARRAAERYARTFASEGDLADLTAFLTQLALA